MLCCTRYPVNISISPELQTLNTGHGGSLTTVHANNAESALSRIASCAMQGGGELPWEVTCRGVVDGIAMVIHMTRADGRRFVEEVAYVKGYEAKENKWDIQRLQRISLWQTSCTNERFCNDPGPDVLTTIVDARRRFAQMRSAADQAAAALCRPAWRRQFQPRRPQPWSSRIS